MDIDLDHLSVKELKEYFEEKEIVNFLHYTPHPKHLEFHNLGAVAKERLFLAANRIGKTMACSLEVCMHLTGNYPAWWEGYRFDRPINVWVGGVSGKEVYGILEKRYFQGEPGGHPWLHPSVVMGQNLTNHEYRIQHVSGHYSNIRFKTYEQRRDAWQGEKLDVCHLDEEPPLDIFTEASLRLMSTAKDHHGMMIISATCLYMSPFVQSFLEEREVVDGTTIVKQRVEKEVKNARVFVMAGWDDAGHLEVNEKKRLIDTLPPHEIEARSKGIPSVGSGMVYPLSQSTYMCEAFDIPRQYARFIGMDFGWKDPTALVFCALDRDTDIAYVYAEYAISEKTPEQHVYHLSQGKIFEASKWAPIIYDPAGRISSQKDGENLVSLYRRIGFNMFKTNNSRELGVQTVLQRLSNGKLKIFSSCTRLLGEMRMYARDETGKIKDGNDHLLDAIRYAVLKGPELGVSEIMRDRQSWQNRSSGGGFY